MKNAHKAPKETRPTTATRSATLNKALANASRTPAAPSTPRLKFFDSIADTFEYMSSELQATLEDDAEGDPSSRKELRQKISDIAACTDPIRIAIAANREPRRFRDFAPSLAWPHFTKFDGTMPDGRKDQAHNGGAWHYLIQGNENKRDIYTLAIWNSDGDEFYYINTRTYEAAEFFAQGITDDHLDSEDLMNRLGFTLQIAGTDF